MIARNAATPIPGGNGVDASERKQTDIPFVRTAVIEPGLRAHDGCGADGRRVGDRSCFGERHVGPAPSGILMVPIADRPATCGKQLNQIIAICDQENPGDKNGASLRRRTSERKTGFLVSLCEVMHSAWDHTIGLRWRTHDVQF
jgi:hypothetical protein